MTFKFWKSEELVGSLQGWAKMKNIGLIGPIGLRKKVLSEEKESVEVVC